MPPPDRTAQGLELAARLTARALRDQAEKVAALERTVEGLRSELATSRQVQEAVLAELRSAQRGTVMALVDRHPWAAVALVLLAILGFSGQLYLLPSLAPLLGGVHAAGS